MDSSGYVHMSYYDHANTKDMVATNRSGSWVSTVLATDADKSSYLHGQSVIGIDQSNGVHVVYYDITGTTTATMIHAKAASGSSSFSSYNMDTAAHINANPGISMDMVLDSSNKVHVSYQSRDYFTPTYIYGSAGSYVKAQADPSNMVSGHISIALNYNGYPMMVYSKSGSTYFSTNMSGSFVVTTITSSAEWDSHSIVEAGSSSIGVIAGAQSGFGPSVYFRPPSGNPESAPGSTGMAYVNHLDSVADGNGEIHYCFTRSSSSDASGSTGAWYGKQSSSTSASMSVYRFGELTSSDNYYQECSIAVSTL